VNTNFQQPAIWSNHGGCFELPDHHTTFTSLGRCQ